MRICVKIRVSDIPGKAKKRDPGKKFFHSRDPGNSREIDRRFTLKGPKGVCKESYAGWLNYLNFIVKFKSLNFIELFELFELIRII